MKKLKLSFLIVCVPLMATQIIAQGPQIQNRIWKDGNPSFQHTTPVENVKMDASTGIISLIPTFDFYQEPAGFQFILPVVDSSWAWPKSPKEKVEIILAEDIERYVDIDGIHYVVTDKDGGKIVDLTLSDANNAWVLKGPIGETPETSQTLNNPVDTYVYQENGVPTFLITDQGRHRVLKVDRYRNKCLWQYGDGNPDSAFNRLRFPSDAMALPATGQVLICDQENDRVILVNEVDKSIAWRYGQLSSPVDIDYDFNTKEVLITDQGNNRVIKVDAQKVVTWEYNTGLNSPTDADLLANGNVLICDKNNNRLIEVNYNKQIVWQLEGKLENLVDADRLSDNMHLVITNGQPARIGYIAREFISDARYLNRAVAFDQLFWSAETPEPTTIKIQFRTENTLGELIAPTTPWRGPTENVPFYTSSGDSINPLHDGHKIYQFKATLNPGEPRYTPVLNNVRVTYRYYDTEKSGQVISEAISDPEEYIITRWDSLIFNTILPPNPDSRDKVRIVVTILDANNNNPLWSFIADQFNSKNKVALHNIESLKLVQSIKLQANFSTNTSSATPVLKDWEVKWQATPLTDAKVEFVKLVNQEFKSAAYYRAPLAAPGQEYIDYVNVKLVDLNLLPIDSYELIDLNITSLLTNDSEAVKLSRKTQGWYIMETSIPLIISDSVVTNDNVLQVVDRDYLMVSYTDPFAPSDRASDTALVVQNTTGIIQFLVQDKEGSIPIQDKYFAAIDTATIGDTIYVHIAGEKDRDLLPDQDIFSVVIFDDFKTSDVETLAVAEVPDSLGQYRTGEFLSTGIRLIASEIPVYNDSLLQTYDGSRISVIYEGTIAKIPIVPVIGKQLPIPIIAYSGVKSLDFDIAPNPYYGDRHDLLRIRVASAIGDITVELIEVYNFAGQKITAINENQLKFYYDYPIPAEQYGYADGWWNLKDQNATAVSSGTYWVKVTGKVVSTNQSLSQIKKLVILR